MSKEQPPLIKFEKPETGIGAYAHIIALVGALALAVAVYVAGIVLSIPLMTGLALFIGLFAVLGYMVVKRKLGISSDIDVDEEVQKYREDLIDTFKGYRVEYSKEIIDESVEEYREILERETASMSDINIATMSQVVSDNIQRRREMKKEPGDKRFGFKRKKNRDAYDENGEIVNLRDDD